MNNLPDKDTKLTNFLRQNCSIAPLGAPELEDRLMIEIDLLPAHPQPRFSPTWQRYMIGGIGLIVAGIATLAIFQTIDPPEQSIAELDQLNLFLEAHVPNLTNHSELDSMNHEDLVDLDPDLF